MIRRFIAGLCLVLLAVIIASWVRSLISPDTFSVRLNDAWVVTLRHAQGILTVVTTDANVMFSLPHWIMVLILVGGLIPVYYLGHRARLRREAKQDAGH